MKTLSVSTPSLTPMHVLLLVAIGETGKQKNNIHMLLVELQHPLRARFVARRQPCLAPVEAAVLVLLVPHQVGPHFVLGVLFDGVDAHDERVPGVVARVGRFPRVRVDVRVACRRRGRGVVVTLFVRQGALATSLLLLLAGGFMVGVLGVAAAGGLTAALFAGEGLAGWQGFSAHGFPVGFEDFTGASVRQNRDQYWSVWGSREMLAGAAHSRFSSVSQVRSAFFSYPFHLTS